MKADAYSNMTVGHRDVGLLKSRPARRKSFVATVTTALLIVLHAVLPAVADDSSVILSYHRFAKESGSLTTTLAELEAHIAHLRDGGYQVLSISQVIAAITGGLPLPQRAVAISIEGSHESVYRLAWPRFKAAGFPFAVMVTTDAVERGGNAAGWDNLREMASAGVEIGTHGAFYRVQVGRSMAGVAADLARARRRIAGELGAPPRIFSYPYGQYDGRVRELVAEHGFVAALGQQSGPAYSGSDIYALPRFSVFGPFAEPARFRLVLEVLPLPVSELVPALPIVSSNPPPIGFTVAEGIGPLNRLACFASGLGQLPLNRLGARRIELRLDAPLPGARVRINCTMPARDGDWRWLGLHLVLPPAPAN